MIKFILTQGIGFSPASVKFIPTLGFSVAAAPVIVAIMGYTTKQGP